MSLDNCDSNYVTNAKPFSSVQAAECEKHKLCATSLRAYAPELNPVEYLWGHWKQHEIPSFCPKDFNQLSHFARQALRRMRRRPVLVTAFWKQAGLFDDRHYIR